mgnify:CR=1 FL=1
MSDARVPPAASRTRRAQTDTVRQRRMIRCTYNARKRSNACLRWLIELIYVTASQSLECNLSAPCAWRRVFAMSRLAMAYERGEVVTAASSGFLVHLTANYLEFVQDRLVDPKAVQWEQIATRRPGSSGRGDIGRARVGNSGFCSRGLSTKLYGIHLQ